MRKAVIDLGTNTFNILIADVGENEFTVLHSEKEGVSLGMGGINQNIISPEAFQRGINAIRNFKLICINHNVNNIRAFGTSALRGAKNADLFVKQIKDELEIDINIISGEKEAELIYKGVKWSYNFENSGVIMDIGGGSTEFIFADKNGMNEMVSLDIGVSRIYQELSLNDPFTEKDINKINDWLDSKEKKFFEGKKSELLIGASGSFETFYELIHNEPFPEAIRSIEVPMKDFNSIIDEILYSSQENRNQNKFIINIRKKMAPIAAAKVKWIIKKLGITRVIISPCSLKEGALRI